MNKDHNVIIGVCTFKRPKMLEDCLLSLVCQSIDANLIVKIVVIDNEPMPNNETLVTNVAAISPFPMHYVHQPKRGIAAARNAAAEAAMRFGADWIAFIDDDEIADLKWLSKLFHDDYSDTPVLVGANHTVYPEPMPFWVQEKDAKGYEGQNLKTAYTGNVRFSTDLLKAGLRFEEKLGLMGGEDNEFFAKAHAMGFEIRRTLRAITYETAHEERLTYLAQMYRAYWCSASELRRLAITRGWFGAALRKTHTIPLNLIFGIGWLFAAFMVAPVSLVAFRDLALEGGKKMAKALGRAAAIIGLMPQPYRITHGR